MRAAMFEDFPSWQSARTARAAAPRPDEEHLRAAYLDLLKLTLCDLAGTRTGSVGKNEDGSVTSRELEGEDLRLRSAGMDWPLEGLTMAGLTRLDDLQECVESVVREAVPGDLIETGVWRGGASMLMRATLDALGERDRTVYAADSFQGFPTADAQGHLNAVDFLSVSLEEVQSNFERFGLDSGVEFVAGFFADTMPELSDRRWSIVRLDGDTYDATWLTLESLYPNLAPGGYLIVDDYGALRECARAVDDFRDQLGLSEPLVRVDWTCVRWRREHDSPTGELPRPLTSRASEGATAPSTAMERPARQSVPTVRERELEQEAAALREQLTGAGARRERSAGAALAGPAAFLRRKLGGGRRAS